MGPSAAPRRRGPRGSGGVVGESPEGRRRRYLRRAASAHGEGSNIGRKEKGDVQGAQRRPERDGVVDLAGGWPEPPNSTKSRAEDGGETAKTTAFGGASGRSLPPGEQGQRGGADGALSSARGSP
jgi:hypothetical protein